MGYILEETPEMGEYSGEVRRESFYLSGAANNVWWRRIPGTKQVLTTHLNEGNGIEISDAASKPDGEGWEFGYVYRHHGIHVYASGPLHQGTVEILIEDIPKIRAVLDQVEAHVKR